MHSANVLGQGTPIREEEEVSVELYTEAGNAKALNSMVADVICYRGKNPKPAFMDIEPGELCFIGLHHEISIFCGHQNSLPLFAR